MPAPSDALTARALNRALLDRQLLLRREPLPGAAGPRADRVIETVERLVGLQAQAPFPPYYGLWSRLDGFRPGDLAELLLTRKVVRIGLSGNQVPGGVRPGHGRRRAGLVRADPAA
jgi:hypothetical protein